MNREEIIKEMQHIGVADLEKIKTEADNLITLVAVQDIMTDNMLDNNKKIEKLYKLFYVECGMAHIER